MRTLLKFKIVKVVAVLKLKVELREARFLEIGDTLRRNLRGISRCRSIHMARNDEPSSLPQRNGE